MLLWGYTNFINIEVCLGNLPGVDWLTLISIIFIKFGYICVIIDMEGPNPELV